jgi:membrane protein YdbS with pleckstrin-like domain
MLVEITHYKLKASSILETIIAALVILLSFSAGMMLYHKTLHSSWSTVKMTAVFEASGLADSLAHAPEHMDQEILREEIKYEVTFAEDERFEGLLRLRIRGYDRSGFQLSELNRMINEH